MIPIEVRKKIIEARKKGLKLAEIEKAYGYHKTSISRLLKLSRETGEITPKTDKCGRKTTTDAADLEKMKELIKARPDITLEEIKEEMKLSISLSAISQKVRNKLGFRVKKRQYMQVREIEPM